MPRAIPGTLRGAVAAVHARIGAVGLFLLVAHTAHLIELQVNRATLHLRGAGDLLLVAWSYVTLILLICLVRAVFSFGRAAFVAANLGLVALEAALSAYVFTTKTSLEYALVVDNFGSAFSRESTRVILSSLDPDPFVIAAAAVAVLLHRERRSRLVSRTMGAGPRLSRVAILGAAYAAAVLAPVPSLDEATHLARSAWDYYARPGERDIRIGEGEYPEVREGFALTPGLPPPPGGRMPNIFVVAVESFDGTLVERRTPEGREYTPRFNELIRRGLYVERFYANSIQTAQGHFAILTSVVPSLRGLVFRRYANLSLRALPEILRERGYETVFFQAHENKEFDNANAFFLDNGFDHHETLGARTRPEDAPLTWGWGPEDSVLYKRGFEYVDELRRGPAAGRPLFVFMATVNNHMRFDVPPGKRMVYAEPKTVLQKYANSVAITDGHLPAFFEELRSRPDLGSSIVVITGDHAFPLGEHGITHNEAGYYEECFRVPFLLIWEGQVAPSRIAGRAGSQVDIAPTLVDLLRLPVGPNHFAGESLLSPDRGRPVYLVQPYDGTWLGVVRHPLKYVLRLRTGEEHLYDLDADPGETRDLIAERRGAPELGLLRGDIAYLRLNQHLIEHDRIFPRGAGKPVAAR